MSFLPPKRTYDCECGWRRVCRREERLERAEGGKCSRGEWIVKVHGRRRVFRRRGEWV